MVELRFLVYLLEPDKKSRSFKGWLTFTLQEALLDEELSKFKEELIESGKSYILKHYKNLNQKDILYLHENCLEGDFLLYDYEVMGRKVQILYRYVGKMEYLFSKIFPFLYNIF